MNRHTYLVALEVADHEPTPVGMAAEIDAASAHVDAVLAALTHPTVRDALEARLIAAHYPARIELAIVAGPVTPTTVREIARRHGR